MALAYALQEFRAYCCFAAKSYKMLILEDIFFKFYNKTNSIVYNRVLC